MATKNQRSMVFRVTGGLLRFIGLPWRRKTLYLAAAIELYRARFRIVFVPFPKIAPRLGTISETPAQTPIDSESYRTARVHRGFTALAAFRDVRPARDADA